MASAAVSSRSVPYWPKDIPEQLGLKHVTTPTWTQTSPAAEIAFHPDRALYEARRERRLREGGLQHTVPDGWPQKFEGPIAWTGKDLVDEAQYVYQLSAADKLEIKRALAGVQGKSYDEITSATFELPLLGPQLRKIQKQVYHGIGFAVVRGLNVDELSPDECQRIFLGCSSYLAAQRGPQNQDGDQLLHLTDYGRVDSDVDLPIHTDITCDIVATLTIKCSTYGGEAALASTWTIYNELAATRPDLIHVLARPDWPFDTYGRDPAYYNRAILFHHEGKAFMNFSRRVLTGHPISGRTLRIPSLTEAQAEALDAVHFTAQKHKLNFATEKGEMRFINNFALLHGREAYSDKENFEASRLSCEDEMARRSQRHLLRMWLHDEQMVWKLPPALKLVWARAFHDPNRSRRWRSPILPLEVGPKPGPPPPPKPNPQPIPAPCD